MKYFATLLLSIGALGLSFFPGFGRAQSVTIGAISASRFCTGDPISVSFDVSGYWGHKNAFTLQMSNPTGSFSNGFINLGSVLDTIPGMFTISASLPNTISTSRSYRFRILGAVPYTPSADNGNDIAVGGYPSVLDINSPGWGAVGVPVALRCMTEGPDNLTDSMYWDFGSDATPQKISGIAEEVGKQVTDVFPNYSTGGQKTVTIHVVLPGGCSRDASFGLHIFDCSIPRIANYARVIDSNTIVYAVDTVHDSILTTFAFPNHSMVWVNPGVSLQISGGQFDTVYAEAGSIISGGDSCQIYLKPGASCIGGYANVVIYADGASVPASSPNLVVPCSALDFDYTSAPPNRAFPASVNRLMSASLIQISPNPASGEVTIYGAPRNTETINVFNLLGQNVVQLKAPQLQNFKIDLSKFLSGVYYVRIASPNSVLTKKIVKE